ncbi:MAG: cation transporter [Syntrophorhabdaceae bacterium]|nr:cation transporter [Syntrophorhabdaceae bacterium]
MKLQDVQDVISITIDIPARKVTIFHLGVHDEITGLLNTLNLGAYLFASEITDDKTVPEVIQRQRKVLIQVLLINLFFFFLEVVTGIMAGSMGLVADSLDMLADSIVYGLSLFAVGAHVSRKKTVAGIAGYFQGLLAITGFVEVIRRFVGYGENPDFKMMVIISFFALLGNILCLYLLQRSKSSDAHMQASMIFTSNDVIVNAGVIVAGFVVYITSSRIPDLIIGAIVFAIVAMGAYRIIRLSR